MEFFLIILGGLFSLIGLIGCFVPGLPGPILNYAAILILNFGVENTSFSFLFLLIFAVAVGVAQLVDYLFPIFGARFWGVSKYGIWGSIIGLFLGAIFFPPFGIILGSFAGAFLGEFWMKKEGKKAVQAGVVAFWGNIASILFQFILASILTIYFFIKVFS